MLHGRNTWINEQQSEILQLSTKILDYFTSCGHDDEENDSTTTTTTTTLFDISGVRVKLECDIDIEQLGTNATIFYGSDEYVPHSNGSVLIRSSDDVEGACAKPNNVVVKTEPVMDDGASIDPVFPSSTVGFPSMIVYDGECSSNSSSIQYTSHEQVLQLARLR